MASLPSLSGVSTYRTENIQVLVQQGQGICELRAGTETQTITTRSNLPGRRSAGSKTSARLVAPRTMTAELLSNPSISWRLNSIELNIEQKGKQGQEIQGFRQIRLTVSSWLSVCSRSSLLTMRNRPSRLFATASIWRGKIERQLKVHKMGLQEEHPGSKSYKKNAEVFPTSSMKIIEGASFLALAKRSRTLEAPIPT